MATTGEFRFLSWGLFGQQCSAVRPVVIKEMAIREKVIKGNKRVDEASAGFNIF
jgi:hypothetical protein